VENVERLVVYPITVSGGHTNFQVRKVTIVR